MRLWSLHPSLLDRQGLIACWRESLLAQAVLRGSTRGYTRHPQLERFRDHPRPLTAVAAYLEGLYSESRERGYRFDGDRILGGPADHLAQVDRITVTDGQLRLEWAHLQSKLAARSPHLHDSGPPPTPVPVHPLFDAAAGPPATWERS
ncbi:pyrimidine dimer DNA glycosylase/endonuclease V [Garicola koreensis]|uniref:pyrimidine dimer DNA glycosylase/endonuclease V n=1 Tax=Garicola koreensis TaxID=1262554 RepID=UPI0031EB1BCA